MEYAKEWLQAYCNLVWDGYEAYCQKTEHWPVILVIALPIALGYALQMVLPQTIFLLTVATIMLPLTWILLMAIAYGLASSTQRR